MKIPSSLLLVFLLGSFPIWSGEPEDAPGQTRLRLRFAEHEVIVLVEDHPVTRTLLSQLPLTLPARDYIGKEKIADLPWKLPSDGAGSKSRGDFAYYAPWGNLAIFYNGEADAGNGLIILGSIEKGKPNLSRMEQDFEVTIEVVH